MNGWGSYSRLYGTVITPKLPPRVSGGPQRVLKNQCGHLRDALEVEIDDTALHFILRGLLVVLLTSLKTRAFHMAKSSLATGHCCVLVQEGTRKTTKVEKNEQLGMKNEEKMKEQEDDDDGKRNKEKPQGLLSAHKFMLV